MLPAKSRSPWPLRIAVLAMLSWIPLSCDFRDPVVPEAPSPADAPPRLSVYEPNLDPIMSSAYSFVAPPSGTIVIAADSPTSTGPHVVAQVTGGTYVRGVLTGSISGSFAPDSLCTTDPGFDAEAYQEGGVTFSLGGSTGGSLLVRPGEPQSGQVTYIGWLPDSTTILARRNFAQACIYAPIIVGGSVMNNLEMGYSYTGQQQVLFEPILPFEVSAAPDFVVSGGNVDFQMTSEFSVTDQRWEFHPGDTATSPAGPDQGVAIYPSACQDDATSCTWNPTSSGRMYLRGTLEGALAVTLPSNIVWVRDSIPSTCGTPSEPVPGPGEGPVCPEKLTLGCDAPSLIRTDSISCRVFFPSEVTTSNVTRWRFVGGENDEFVIEDSVVLDSIWKGAMVASGAITVFADLDTVPDSASVLVQVNPRSWTVTNLLSKSDYEQGPGDPLWEADLPKEPITQGDLGHTHWDRLLYNGSYPTGGTILVVTGGGQRLSRLQRQRTILCGGGVVRDQQRRSRERRQRMARRSPERRTRAGFPPRPLSRARSGRTRTSGCGRT